MGLVRARVIFGAGYVLGRREGHAEVAELANRPEVTQLRRATATAPTSAARETVNGPTT